MRILITGVSGNLGRALARQALAAGHAVVGLSRTNPHIEDMTWMYADLSNQYINMRLLRMLKADFAGQVELCFLAHGLQEPKSIIEMGQRDVETMMNVNLYSLLHLVRFLRINDALAEGSVIVFCSSIQARQPRAGRGLYGMAKAGLEVLARTINQEWSPEVRAVALRLGHLDKPMAGIQVDYGQIAPRLPFGLIPCQSLAALILELPRQTSIAGVLDLSAGHSDNIW